MKDNPSLALFAPGPLVSLHLALLIIQFSRLLLYSVRQQSLAVGCVHLLIWIEFPSNLEVSWAVRTSTACMDCDCLLPYRNYRFIDRSGRPQLGISTSLLSKNQVNRLFCISAKKDAAPNKNSSESGTFRYPDSPPYLYYRCMRSLPYNFCKMEASSTGRSYHFPTTQEGTYLAFATLGARLRVEPSETEERRSVTVYLLYCSSARNSTDDISVCVMQLHSHPCPPTARPRRPLRLPLGPSSRFRII